MSANAKEIFDSAPRVTSAQNVDDVLIRQGNQLVKIALSVLLAGLGGESGSFVADGGETITVENGLIVGITP